MLVEHMKLKTTKNDMKNANEPHNAKKKQQKCFVVAKSSGCKNRVRFTGTARLKWVMAGGSASVVNAIGNYLT
jgi:hypothetical protein